MDEIAIKVENLRIRYKSLGSYSIKKNFLKLKKNKRETFEAVRGISFEVPKGQILGIIGKMEVENLRCCALWQVFFHLMRGR